MTVERIGRKASAQPTRFGARTLQTPLGGLMVVVDDAGSLRAAEFEDRGERLERSLSLRFGGSGYTLVPREIPGGIASALERYFAGGIDAIDDMPVTLDGTAFQNTVWAALRSVKPGNPVPYSALAARIGRPRAVRAVGHANGSNPFCVVVPCHRLVGANGALTGYGGGLERKRWLIGHEARAGASPTS